MAELHRFLAVDLGLKAGGLNSSPLRKTELSLKKFVDFKTAR
jgi:hypothetical protein